MNLNWYRELYDGKHGFRLNMGCMLYVPSFLAIYIGMMMMMMMMINRWRKWEGMGTLLSDKPGFWFLEPLEGTEFSTCLVDGQGSRGPGFTPKFGKPLLQPLLHSSSQRKTEFCQIASLFLPNTKKIKELVASRICQKMHLEDLCDIMWQWASWNNSQTGKATFRGGLVRPSVVAMPCGAAVVVVLGHFCIVALRSINEFQGIRVCLRKVHCQDIKAWLKLGATAKTPFGVASPLPTEITEITGILQISQCSQLKRMKVLRWWI